MCKFCITAGMTTLDALRRFYADEIRCVANLQSAALVEALAQVPREAFLGPGPWDIATPDPARPGSVVYHKTPDADPRHVYHNVLIATDASRELNNGHPATLTACLDALTLRPGDRFLHVGCGVGYYTALAAAVVGTSGHVVGVELDERLAARAAQNLRHLPHVSVLAQDAATYAPPPRDAILINAGFTHPLPLWLDALAPGGRLLVPVTAVAPGSPIGTGWAVLVTRDAASRYRARTVMPMAIFASPTGRLDALDAEVRQALATGRWRQVSSVRRDPHERTESCCVHASGACLSQEDPEAQRP